MAKAVVYHPDFENDVRAATDWYAERHPDLAVDFRVRLRTAISELMYDPERPSAVDYSLRYWRTERFPYVVLYDASPETLMILGVMHTSQDSKKWLKRRDQNG